MNPNTKILLDILQTLTQRRAFFSIWFVTVAIFIFLIIRNYQKHTRRNFRPPSDVPLPRRLSGAASAPPEGSGKKIPHPDGNRPKA